MDSIPRRYIGLIGLGLLYLWGSALMAWVPLWQSNEVFFRVVAFFGLALVSISGIAIALYTNAIEMKIKRLAECNDLSKAEAAMWKDQTQRAITLAERQVTVENRSQ